jgi:MFS family permease
LTLRQTAVPEKLLGRVNSVYNTFAMGGFALGSLAGGLLARRFGLTAPFWIAAAVLAVVAMLAWRLFTAGHLTTSSHTPETEPSPAPD